MMLGFDIMEAGKETCSPNKGINHTVRDYPTLHYVIYGYGSLQINNIMLYPKSGDLFLLPKGVQVTYCSDHDRPWQYYWIGLRGAMIDGLLSKASLTYANPVMKVGYDSEIIDIFESIINNYFVNFECQCFYYTTRLLCKFFPDDELSKKKNEIITNPKKYVDDSIFYIMCNYEYRVTIKDIANNVNINPNYLSGLFRKYEGVSTKRFLTQYRIKRACEFFENDKMMIKKVAQKVGYFSLSKFCTAFKEQKGMTPKEYLQRHGSKEEI